MREYDRRWKTAGGASEIATAATPGRTTLVQQELAPSGNARAGGNRATQVAYFQHNDHSIKRWRDVPKQGSHPLVFSAKGSHASYDSPGKKSLRGGLASDYAGFGAKWQTWQHLEDARKQGWYGYGGAWGEVGEIKDTTGPQGPSRHKGAAPKGW